MAKTYWNITCKVVKVNVNLTFYTYLSLKVRAIFFQQIRPERIQHSQPLLKELQKGYTLGKYILNQKEQSKMEFRGNDEQRHR